MKKRIFKFEFEFFTTWWIAEFFFFKVFMFIWLNKFYTFYFRLFNYLICNSSFYWFFILWLNFFYLHFNSSQLLNYFLFDCNFIFFFNILYLPLFLIGIVRAELRSMSPIVGTDSSSREQLLVSIIQQVRKKLSYLIYFSSQFFYD